jgi:hypothetical protein
MIGRGGFLWSGELPFKCNPTEIANLVQVSKSGAVVDTQSAKTIKISSHSSERHPALSPVSSAEFEWAARLKMLGIDFCLRRATVMNGAIGVISAGTTSEFPGGCSDQHITHRIAA